MQPSISLWKQRLRAAGLCLLPGLLAGLQLAGLLYFLNPHLRFGPLVLLRTGLIHGLELALLSLVLLLPWCWWRPERAGRILPWALSVVLAAAAILDWVHASRFSFYLPPGINVRLIKAALWLSLGALICFYTALLHSLRDRPYGWRSRVGVFLVALASVYVLVERREAFDAPEPREPRRSIVSAAGRVQLFVVGIESASIDAVLPLAEQGELPFLQASLRLGAYGRLDSLSPPRHVALWTTISTGQYPYHHGIVGRRAWRVPWISRRKSVLLLPQWVGFRSWGLWGASPLWRNAMDQRRMPGWRVTARLGLSTAVVGWPLSAPLGGGLNFGFSDQFFYGRLSAGSAHPPELAERGLLFQVLPENVDSSLLPGLSSPIPPAMASAVAADKWRWTLSRFLLEQRPEVDVLFLHLPGLATVSARSWGGYVATHFGRMPGDPRVEAAAERVKSYYRWLDSMLARLWEQCADRCLLAIVSGHGVTASPEWRRVLGLAGESAWLGGDWEDAPDGLLLLRGSGVRPETLLTGAQLVDVLPTVLYGLGLPIARNLDGQVLTEAYATAFLAEHPLSFVPSYRTMVSPPSPELDASNLFPAPLEEGRRGTSGKPSPKDP